MTSAHACTLAEDDRRCVVCGDSSNVLYAARICADCCDREPAGRSDLRWEVALAFLRAKVCAMNRENIPEFWEFVDAFIAAGRREVGHGNS